MDCSNKPDKEVQRLGSAGETDEPALNTLENELIGTGCGCTRIPMNRCQSEYKNVMGGRIVPLRTGK